MPQKRLIRFGLLLSARMAGAAALFAANLLIARYLGFEALATYAIFVALVSISAVLISSGHTAIAPVFIAEYSARNQPGLLRGFMRTAFARGALLLAFFLIGVLLIDWFGGTLPVVTDLEMALAVVAAAAATAILGFNSAVLVGMKKQVAALIPETFVRPVLFMSLAGLFLATGLITKISEVLWLLTFCVWLTFGFMLFRDRKMHKAVSEVKQETDPKRWRRASLPWMGISLLWDFMVDLVLLMTSIFAGSVEIAILHICFRYRVLAGFGMRTIHTLLMPEITENAVSGDKDGVRRKLFQVNLASLGYSSAAMLCFAILGTWLLGIFSPDAVNAVPILLIVSATMVIRAIFGPAPLVLAIHNFHMTTLTVSAISMIAAMVFIGATFAHLGIMAAAIGYTGANLMISGTLWYLTKKKTGIDCSIFVRPLMKSRPGGRLRSEPA